MTYKTSYSNGCVRIRSTWWWSSDRGSHNKKVCYRWLHSAPRVKREMCILPIGVGAFRPKFYGYGVTPLRKCWYRWIGSWLRYNFTAGSFQTTKLCNNAFLSKFLRKGQIWASEPNFGEVRGDARPWLMARWKASGRLPICLSWTFFAICYGSGAEAKCVQLGCFHRGSTS